ncbi:MAG: hypothetical protein JNL19_09310 [Burkholderiales bacterium]|nr:hypothetical protein [Burkholderiales bacterium]
MRRPSTAGRCARARQIREAVGRALLRPLDHAITLRSAQWLVARERLLTQWLARTGQRARASLPPKPRGRPSGKWRDGAIRLLPWWEYESPLKRRLALEATLQRMFSLMPAT